MAMSIDSHGVYTCHRCGGDRISVLGEPTRGPADYERNDWVAGDMLAESFICQRCGFRWSPIQESEQRIRNGRQFTDLLTDILNKE